MLNPKDFEDGSRKNARPLDGRCMRSLHPLLRQAFNGREIEFHHHWDEEPYSSQVIIVTSIDDAYSDNTPYCMRLHHYTRKRHELPGVYNCSAVLEIPVAHDASEVSATYCIITRSKKFAGIYFRRDYSKGSAPSNLGVREMFLMMPCE